MSRALRHLDLGAVSPLRSQALYHGLAAAMDEDSPDTVLLCSPAAPYLCIGYHQTADEVLDLPFCRRAGWPVFRRKIGGGAVYLDEAQLFYQVIVHRRRAPFAVADIYRTYLAAPVLALRRLGLDAALQGVNEIEVRGRRIAGTGGGQLGDAMVVVGNLLFDFPRSRMTRAWRAPSVPFRRLAGEGLRLYLTTLREERHEIPAMRDVADLLADSYSRTLGRPIVPGRLSAREEMAIAGAETELASEAFVVERTARPRRCLKIARGVSVRETTVPGPHERFRLTVRLRDGLIDAVAVAARERTRWARELTGARLEAGSLAARLGDAPGGSRVIETLLALGAGGAEAG